MSHPYDASTKYLIETRLADWLPLCGRATTAELEIINADLSTVTAAADRVLLVREERPGCCILSWYPAVTTICCPIFQLIIYY
jgi:hypothetical protein